MEYDDKRKRIADGIRAVITRLMNGVLDRVMNTDPFIPEEHHARKPLYAALVPDEIFKGSHFERRFVTPFGNAWEKLAVVVAEVHMGRAVTGATIRGTVRQDRLRRIQDVLNSEDHATTRNKKRQPDWEADLAYVLEGGGEPIPVTVVADLLTEDVATGKKYAFELKAPLPNSDQTKVSKEKMLKLMAMDEQPVEMAYFALVYNPYGRRQDYSWSFPKRWFSLEKDRSWLIGDEFWDFLGGQGTYECFIEEIGKLGHEYKNIIYKKYLNIDPIE